MTSPHLIYFSDPMCSWCYGFSPVIEKIRASFGRALPIRIIMGGLRPGAETPMTEEAKLEVGEHWVHVHEATGLPFNGAGMSAPGFIYDTDPAARAVVVARRDGEEMAAQFLGRIGLGRGLNPLPRLDRRGRLAGGLGRGRLLRLRLGARLYDQGLRAGET